MVLLRSFPLVTTGVLLQFAARRSTAVVPMRASSSSSSVFAYPRAAVAVTIQSLQMSSLSPYYLLIQRANPPDQGKWSLPGGKIDVGESTLDAAKREITEETQLAVETCQWLDYPFMTTDAIFVHKNVKGTKEEQQQPQDKAAAAEFHYLIAHCFARASNGLPAVVPSDDALDAKWYTLQEIENMHESQVSKFVVRVIQRAEELHTKGALL